jgi:glycosyltransferase involved in cell wall biosynthesis
MVKVSVVIPSYNREDVKEAVKSALNQTVKEIEVIVVDDHSEVPVSNHLSDIEDQRLKIIRHEENRGGSAARNTGIEESKGQYIAFLDDDDKWKEEKLEKQLEKMNQLPGDYIACYTKVIYSSDRKEEVVGSEVEGDFTEELLKTKIEGAFGSSLLVERKIVEKIGGFDPDFRRHQDWEFVLRLLEKGKIGVLKEPLVIKRDEYGLFDAQTMLEEKKKFLSKFEYKLQQMDLVSRREVYAQHYIELSALFSYEGDLVRTTRFYLKAITNYPFLEPRKLLKPPYYFLTS